MFQKIVEKTGQQQDANQTKQQQQQQQQDAQTAQEQQQNQQDAQTNQQQQQQGSERWWDDRQGAVLGDFDRNEYLERLNATDFSSLDATQSARELLRIRETLLRYGLP